MTTAHVQGSWKMVEAWDAGDDPADEAQRTYPWGKPPLGYWVFDPAGNFSLLIYPNPALAIPKDPFSGDPQPAWLSPAAPWQPPMDLLLQSFSTPNPFAYFGTYEVQAGDHANSGTLLLTVQADVMRAYTGTVQSRSFTLDAQGYLNVGDGVTYLRKLERVAQFTCA
ncbi:lipocalin-like domain-containing protein [Massilia sp. W12]|uniref:lipocalin-like domain-containing protein n=1 Tax=Massilia sp. W12 TaxID=3126507 RepID=UPI0030D31AA8